MFSRLLEVLAPHIKTNQERLHENWSNVKRYYQTTPDAGNEEIAYTDIPEWLETMVRYLKEEDIERISDGKSGIGPCLEYFINNRVLDFLYEWSQSDIPRGMHLQVLRFSSLLLTNVRGPLLDKSVICVPIQRLIIATRQDILLYSSRAPFSSPSSAEMELTLELVKLIHAVFRQFRGEGQQYANMFFERGYNITSDVSSGDLEDSQVPKRMSNKLSQFYLFTTLFDYINSSNEIGLIAREGILFCLRLLERNDVDPQLSQFLIFDSNFCEIIITRLSILYSQLPEISKTFHIINRTPTPFLFRSVARHPIPPTKISEKATSPMRSSIFDEEFPQLVMTMDPLTISDEFEALWTFVGEIAMVRCEIIMIIHWPLQKLKLHLTYTLATKFWIPVLHPSLLSLSEEIAASAITRVIILIQTITDSVVMRAFLSFLLGEDFTPEVRKNWKDSTATGKDNGFGLREVLILRIKSEHEELSMAALRLFNAIVETYDQFAIWNLVGRGFGGLRFKGEEYGHVNMRVIAQRVRSLIPSVSDTDLPSSPILGSSPTVATSSPREQDEYFLDAAERRQVVRVAKRDWVYPYPPSPFEEHIQKESDYEGLFLENIYNQLEGMLEGPLERNLAVTNIVSRLVEVLNEDIGKIVFGWDREAENDEKKGRHIRCLWDILVKLSSNAETQSVTIPNFPTRLALAKRRGLSQPSTNAPQSRRSSFSTSGSSSRRPSISSFRNSTRPRGNSVGMVSPTERPFVVNPFARITNFVAAYVVLGEFYKEIIAVFEVAGTGIIDE